MRKFISYHANRRRNTYGPYARSTMLSKPSKGTILDCLHPHVIFLDMWMTGEELLLWTDIIRETFTTPSNPVRLVRLGQNTLILLISKTELERTLRSSSRKSLQSTSIQALLLHTFFLLPEWSVDLLQTTLLQELRRLQLTSHQCHTMSTSSLEKLRGHFCILSMIWTLSRTRL